MAAVLFLRDHRHETAQPLIEWILRYQAIAFGGRTYLEPEGHWGSYLQHRYGGCMATTTCLLGLIPTMTALVEARRSPLAVDTSVHEAAFRDLLIDRRLMHGRNGEIMPLAGRTKADPHGIRWLRPAFPLDYVADLIGLAQAAKEVGVPWDAMPEARALIRSWELPAGGWPMLGKRRIEFAHRPERVDRSARSQIITRRVRDLMSATGSAPGTAGGSLSDEVGGPCAVAPG